MLGYTVDKKLEVEYDERGAEPTCNAIISPGNDPKMIKITSFSLCPCSAWFVPEPSSVGATDGHAADDQEEQATLQMEMQAQAQQDFEFDYTEDTEPLAPEATEEEKPSKSWFRSAPKKEKPDEFKSAGEIELAISMASIKEDYDLSLIHI